MPSPESPATNWKRYVVILALGWVVIWISRMMFTPIYPVLSEYFGGVSNTELGAISSFYFLGYVVMQIPSGLLVDRFGMRRVIVPGFLVFVAGVAVMALSTALPMLYVGSVISGAGCGTFYGIAYTITNVFVPRDKKSLATAVVNSGTAIGSGAGLVSASLLVGTHVISWQTLVACTGALALIMAAVFARSLPGRTRREGAAQRAPEQEGAESGGGLRRLFQPKMVAAYIVYFSSLYAYYLISTWLPNFLETERGFAGSFTGIVSSLVFFAGIPGALVFSRLADRRPEKKIALIVVLQVAAAIMLFLMVQPFPQSLTVAFIVLYGLLGKLTVEPIIISWLGDFAPKDSVTTTFGVFNFFGMSASVFAPAVTGSLTDSFGSGVYGYYLAIAIVVAFTAAFLLIARRKEGLRAATR
ncbi:MAG: MFS transporter [Coriobacteriaceae bacterium]|nr:MFS transporter [Coriobacteriaceae bacterium]